MLTFFIVICSLISSSVFGFIKIQSFSHVRNQNKFSRFNHNEVGFPSKWDLSSIAPAAKTKPGIFRAVRTLKERTINRLRNLNEKFNSQKKSTQFLIKGSFVAFIAIASFVSLKFKSSFLGGGSLLSWILKQEFVTEIIELFTGLANSLNGAKLDSIILLIATSVIIPLFKRLDTSPILGFLITGTLLGPQGLNWVKDVHMIDILGELGIVFFLFEMGLELSLDKLMSMKKYVFGLGTLQFLLTSVVGAFIASTCGLSSAAAVTIGGSLALSSSAFVLQLLKDNEAMGTRYGRASFGILLLQDIAVVPLLVVVELLAKGGSGIGRALAIAGAKALVTLTTMSFVGKKILDRIFSIVAKSKSHEAFLSSILASVLIMSFVTQGIGLSNTLGAFLAGLLLAETRYRYQIEADIAPFRGLLLGFFFLTVGFSIDMKLVLQQGPRILALLFALIAGKATIITGLCMLFGLPFDDAQQAGLLNAQGGEFAFVAFGMAERLGLLDPTLSRTLMTTVALSMALTPYLSSLGDTISKKIETKKGVDAHLSDQDLKQDVQSALQTSNFVFVCGYGRVGKMICEMLDRAVIPYIGVDVSPKKIIDARNKGLPIFYGDVSRPEIIRNFHAGSAKACVVAIGDMASTNKAVVNLRRNYPNMPLLVRAKDRQHQARLQKMFDNIQVMCPVLPDDSVVLTLPFGGAVLQTLGVKKAEADNIIEEFRKEYLDTQFDDQSSFLLTLEQRLPDPEEVIAESYLKNDDEEEEGKREVESGDDYDRQNTINSMIKDSDGDDIDTNVSNVDDESMSRIMGARLDGNMNEEDFLMQHHHSQATMAQFIPTKLINGTITAPPEVIEAIFPKTVE